MKALTAQAVMGFAVVGLCSAGITGCGFKQSKLDADKVIARHFKAISTNGYSVAASGYGAKFFATISREEWERTLERVSGKLGGLQSYTIANWNVRKGASTIGSGTTVELVVQSKYSEYSAQEHFTLFKGTDENDFKIVGHKIQSAGLLK